MKAKKKNKKTSQNTSEHRGHTIHVWSDYTFGIDDNDTDYQTLKGAKEAIDDIIDNALPPFKRFDFVHYNSWSDTAPQIWTAVAIVKEGIGRNRKGVLKARKAGTKGVLSNFRPHDEVYRLKDFASLKRLHVERLKIEKEIDVLDNSKAKVEAMVEKFAKHADVLNEAVNPDWYFNE